MESLVQRPSLPPPAPSASFPSPDQTRSHSTPYPKPRRSCTGRYSEARTAIEEREKTNKKGKSTRITFSYKRRKSQNSRDKEHGSLFLSGKTRRSEARPGTLALWCPWEGSFSELLSPGPSGSTRRLTAATPPPPLPGSRKKGAHEGQPLGSCHLTSHLHPIGQNFFIWPHLAARLAGNDSVYSWKPHASENLGGFHDYEGEEDRYWGTS